MGRGTAGGAQLEPRTQGAAREAALGPLLAEAFSKANQEPSERRAPASSALSEQVDWSWGSFQRSARFLKPQDSRACSRCVISDTLTRDRTPVHVHARAGSQVCIHL